MPRFIPAHATTANATTATVIIPNVIIIFFLSQFFTNTLLDFIKPRLFGDFASSSRLSNPSQKLSFLLTFYPSFFFSSAKVMPFVHAHKFFSLFFSVSLHFLIFVKKRQKDNDIFAGRKTIWQIIGKLGNT